MLPEVVVEPDHVDHNNKQIHCHHDGGTLHVVVPPVLDHHEDDPHHEDETQGMPVFFTALHTFIRHAQSKLLVNSDEFIGSAVCSNVCIGVVSHNEISNHKALATSGVAIDVPS